jgi:acyl-CoA thioesterase-1
MKLGSFFGVLILAGLMASVTGCRTDDGSKASSEMGENPGTPNVAGPAKAVPEAPAPVSKAADAVDVRPLVVCFGDSLTAGYGAEEGFSYPDFLQKALDRDGYHYRVVNEGISGNTTKDGVDRLAGVVKMKAAVVVLEFGGNDGLRGFKVTTTRMNLAKMIEAIKASGAKVVLAGITLPPDYGADYVSTFTATYPTLAKRYNVPVLPFLLKDVYGVDGMMQADRTHATEKGNEIVARNVLPLVEPLLKK